MNENCDVDVAIDRAGYKSWKRQFFFFSSFFRSFYLASFTFGYLWQSSSAACAANKNSEKENTIRGSFAGIHVSSRGIAGFTDQRTAFTRAQSAILQGPDFNLRVERAKNPLFTKLISQKRIRWPYFFNAKTYSTARAECMCEIKKKTAE